MNKIRINWNLQCEIDQKKDDCRREAPHCHITRNGVRVAQVWLNPVIIESGHSLDRNEIDLVIKTVSENRFELEEHMNIIKNMELTIRPILDFLSGQSRI